MCWSKRRFALLAQPDLPSSASAEVVELLEVRLDGRAVLELPADHDAAEVGEDGRQGRHLSGGFKLSSWHSWSYLACLSASASLVAWYGSGDPARE